METKHTEGKWCSDLQEIIRLRGEEIARLREENAEMRMALLNVSQTITMENSLHPDYGWGAWLDREITPILDRAKVQS